jgi:hypothetical protein
VAVHGARSSTTRRGTCSPPDSYSTPEGRVIVSVYSSGAIGRLVPEDVIGLIKYVREHEAEEQAA